MIDKHKNLLFALLAAQLRGISLEAIQKIGAEWKSDPSKDLPDRLLEAGYISPDEQSLVQSFIQEALRAHDGDVEKLVETFGGGDKLESSICGDVVIRNIGDESVTVIGQPPEYYVGGTPLKPQGVEETPGRYTGESEYARGGMGRVLLVHDEHLGRDVAMKELLPMKSPEGNDRTPIQLTTELVGRFLREARITGQLEHPSIVPVYELGRRRDGTIYYTMKLVRGKTLADAIKDTSSLQQRLAYLTHFADLCQAIAYAHSRGVIHRDIKPNNVMVGEFGETVVLDWGLAKSLKDRDPALDKLEETIRQLRLGTMTEKHATTYGHVLGTPTYMPPEQASGQLDRIDARSDVYSLGAVLYELLTGARPFVGADIQEILHKVIEKEPQKIEELAPDAAPELVAICRKAMSKNSADRYATARELAAEVRNYLSGAFVGAYRYSLGEYLSRWMRKNKPLVAVMGAAVAAVVVITIGYVTSLHSKNIELATARDREHEQRVTADTAREDAEQHSYVAQMRLVSEYLGHDDFRSAQEALWNTSPKLRGWEWGHVLNLCNQDRFTIENCAMAAYSPDGKTIATISHDFRARLWSADTGELIREFEPTGVRPLSVAFSPDGTLVVAAAFNGSVYVWHTDGTATVRQFPASKASMHDAKITPDNKNIVGINAEGLLICWNAETGDVIGSVETGGKFSGLAIVAGGQHVVIRTSESKTELRKIPTLELVAQSPGAVAGIAGDGSFYATIDGSVAHVFASQNGTPVGEPLDHGSPIQSMAVDAASHRIATVGLAKDAKIWDVSESRLARTLSLNTLATSIIFLLDPKFVVTASDPATLSLWDVETGKKVSVYRGHSAALTGIQPNPATNGYLTTAYDRQVKVWPVCAPIGSRPVIVENTNLLHARAAANGKSVGMAFNDGAFRVTDLESRQVVGAFQFVGTNQAKIALDAQAKHAAVLSDAYTPMIFDLDAGRVSATLFGHTGSVMDIDISSDGTEVATCSEDGTARVWDASNGRLVATLSGHTGEVLSIRFSPGGKLAVTASSDKTVKVWNVASGACEHTFEGHGALVRFADFDGTGERVLSGSDDNTVRIWSVASGKQIIAMHDDKPVLNALLNTDGSRLFSMTSTSVKIWETRFGDRLYAGNLDSLGVDGLAMRKSEPSELAVFAGNGLTLLESAVLEGATDDNTRKAKLTEYKARAYANPQRLPISLDTVRSVVVIPSAAWGFAVRELAAIESAAHASLSIPIDKKLNAARRAGLNPGDTVLGVNNTRPADGAAVLALLQGTLNEHATAFTLNVKRAEGAEQEMFYFVMEPYASTVEISLPRARAAQILREGRENLAKNFAVQDKIRTDDALATGEIDDESQPITGVTIAKPSNAGRSYFADLGLANTDRLTVLDGKPVTNSEVFRDLLGDCERRLQRGELDKIRLEVERGLYQHVVINLTLQ